ncbi:50s ribosomal protein l1 [Moniliophthora roreri MCA 2997]|uniref:50s ribosomal protein l1 n=2 Tax=Moniliophthora roreri TaxID=221103 RepID=V2XR54_MONRO|nr:50s ribosomal protein l1 [Moniliophthora roreri MCA 2997]
MLGAFFQLGWQCYRTNPLRTAFSRPFSTTPAVQIRKNNAPKIRIPSKRAMAAKAKRRAAKAELADSKLLKLELGEAISVLRAVEVASPKAMYELFVKVEVGNGIAIPKGRYKLPKTAKAGAEETILVFAEGRQAEEARKAGAHVVGGPELIDGILSSRIRATTYISTTSLIRAITPRLGRFLGPQGLMPSERRGTVTDDIAGYMQRIQGTEEWKADKFGKIQLPIASMHFSAEEVVKNFRNFMASVKKATGNLKEAQSRPGDKSIGKAAHIQKVLLSSTQGPSIRISDY